MIAVARDWRVEFASEHLAIQLTKELPVFNLSNCARTLSSYAKPLVGFHLIRLTYSHYPQNTVIPFSSPAGHHLSAPGHGDH